MGDCLPVPDARIEHLTYRVNFTSASVYESQGNNNASGNQAQAFGMELIEPCLCKGMTWRYAQSYSSAHTLMRKMSDARPSVDCTT